MMAGFLPLLKIGSHYTIGLAGREAISGEYLGKDDSSNFLIVKSVKLRGAPFELVFVNPDMVSTISGSLNLPLDDAPITVDTVR